MTNLPENPVDLDPMSYQFNKKGKHYGESLKILGIQHSGYIFSFFFHVINISIGLQRWNHRKSHTPCLFILLLRND